MLADRLVTGKNLRSAANSCQEKEKNKKEDGGEKKKNNYRPLFLRLHFLTTLCDGRLAKLQNTQRKKNDDGQPSANYFQCREKPVKINKERKKKRKRERKVERRGSGKARGTAVDLAKSVRSHSACHASDV